MKNALEPNGKPDPQLLAAYFDGELEGRDDVADVRARIETWLEAHPEAHEEWANHQRLQRAWLDTTPAEPSPAAWRALAERIDAERRRPIAPARRRWMATGIAAACILLLIGLLIGAMRGAFAVDGKTDTVVQAPQPNPPDGDDFEVLPVASASEVTILRIEDADAEAVVVGTFPVSGELDLADCGEVCITCKCPRVMVRQDPPYRPMVWARLDGD